jgi:hypothetical protein
MACCFVTEVSVPGPALLARSGSTTSKPGTRNKNIIRHNTAALSKIGKKAQRESSVLAAKPGLSSKADVSLLFIWLSILNKLAQNSKVPVLQKEPGQFSMTKPTGVDGARGFAISSSLNARTPAPSFRCLARKACEGWRNRQRGAKNRYNRSGSRALARFACAPVHRSCKRATDVGYVMDGWPWAGRPFRASLEGETS